MATSLKQDLIRLRARKTEAAKASKKAKELNNDFKIMQARVLERLEREDVESLKSGGTLFSPVETFYAQIQDRSEFVKWAFGESEPITDFIDRHCVGVEGMRDAGTAAQREALLSAIQETPLLQLKEHGDPLNSLVRERLDDNIPLPPGVTVRTDAYISQRNG